jgi:MarR family transcriptional regulator for hemolysin
MPIGLFLAATAKAVGRAFDEAMVAAGGSSSTWVILISLKRTPHSNQRELAEAVGIQEATLTHHLNGMERDGLLTRQRDPDNRRIHRVELTATGETVFLRLRDVAVAFDERLRTGLPDGQIDLLRDVLQRLQANVTSPVTYVTSG